MVRRQLPKRLLQQSPIFYLLVYLFGSWLPVFHKFAREGFFKFTIHLVPGDNGLRSRLPNLHQGSIDDDSRGPGQEICPTLKLIQVGKCRQHGILDGILSVLSPGKNTEGAGKQPTAAGLEQHIEGLGIALLRALKDQLFISDGNYRCLVAQRTPPFFAIEMFAAYIPVTGIGISIRLAISRNEPSQGE
jgi:hypothetical protein